jgi:adenylosuccinate lyase
MEESRAGYRNPLAARYASREMDAIFSDDTKFRTWRRCWVALAESQHELGLPVSRKQIDELKRFQDDINYPLMEEKERELRHDVMAALLAYGEQCPAAKPILHLGATSCFVTDNSELIQVHRALLLLRRRLLSVMTVYADAAEQYKALACLGYTHFQPAQPTTLGKRITLWLQDLEICAHDLERLLAGYRIRGIKGATGTQDSFLTLLEGDHAKVTLLDELVCRKLGYTSVFPVCGQTYPRLQDARVLDLLKNIAVSSHKAATDFRLMQHLKMVDEPFKEKQVGSSAMAYKKNPMRCERLCSLARYVMSLSPAADQTASLQWFERTLDDSAGRRLYLPEAFLAADALLLLAESVVSGMRVYPRMIARLLSSELPFLATETIMMSAVKKGADRQVVHEALRQGALEAARRIKEEAEGNPLLELLAADQGIPFDLGELTAICTSGSFTGRAEQQVTEYLDRVVRPLLAQISARAGDEEAGGREDFIRV